MEFFKEQVKSVLLNSTDMKVSRFQKFNSNEIQNTKTLKITPILKISSGQISSQNNLPILMVNLRNYLFTQNNLENLIKNTKLFKFKSKYILSKIGYLFVGEEIENLNANSRLGSLTLIYELPNGSILDFYQFSNNDDQCKLYILEKVLNIINRVKGGGINFGGLEPELFIYNPNSDVPVVLIDYSFFSIFESNWGSNLGSDIDPNLKISLGIFDFKNFKSSSYNKPNLLAMVLVFITKIFSSEDNRSTYLELLFKFFSEINSKNQIKTEPFTQIIDKSISNTIINEILHKYLNLVKINEVKRDLFAELLQEFDVKIFILNRNKSKFKISENNKLNPQKDNQLLILTNYLRDSKTSTAKIQKEVGRSFSKKAKSLFENLQEASFIHYIAKIHEGHFKIKSKIFEKEKKITDILKAITNHLKNKISLKADGISKKLKGYVQMIHDEEEIENSLQELEKSTIQTFEKISKFSAVTSYSQIFSNLLNSAKKYNELIKFYRTDILETNFKEINLILEKEINKISSEL